MYWAFGATVCMWAILYLSCLCCVMICRFQWERMLLQTAKVTLIQMSHIQVLAPKGQHIQNAKIWTFECTENAMEKLLAPLLIIVWQYVITWINVFLKCTTHINWFEENIRIFISAKHYENLITDIFQSEDIFFKTILLHWYNSECSFPSQRIKCGWSWSLMVVVVRIWRIVIVGNAHWIRVTKSFALFW